MDDKCQIILQILCSLNQGDTGYAGDRVASAIRQYNQLVQYDVVKGEKIKL